MRKGICLLNVALVAAAVASLYGCSKEKVHAPEPASLAGVYRGVYSVTIGALEIDTLGMIFGTFELEFTFGDSAFSWEQINMLRGQSKGSGAGVYRIENDSIDLVSNEPVSGGGFVRGIQGKYWFSRSEELLTFRRDWGAGNIEGVYLVRED